LNEDEDFKFPIEESMRIICENMIIQNPVEYEKLMSALTEEKDFQPGFKN
jgi:hypothetical protein